MKSSKFCLSYLAFGRFGFLEKNCDKVIGVDVKKNQIY
jgi:hypothetical protein